METTQPKHVPALRFPEFSGNWAIKKLGDICKFLDSERVPLSELERNKRDGIYPYYGASGIIDYIDDYIFDGEYVLLGEDGANILLRNSPLAFLAEGKFWVNNHAHVLRANNSNYFLAESLERITYEKYNTGTAQPKLNAEICKKIKLILPLKVEQQKIATFLSAVDTKIEQLAKKKALWEQYKKGMMQKLFRQEIRFKDEQGKDYPGWEEKQLDDIAKFSKGKGISKSDTVSNGIVKCILYGQLYTYYGETISNVISSTNIPNAELVFSKKNDVIIPASGETALDIASAACVCVDGVALGGDINIIRCQQNGIFLAYYLNNKRNDIARLAQGKSVIHLYGTHLKSLKLRIPSKKEQQKIATFLSAIDQKIELVDTEIKQARAFKKGLLQQMFI